jgi:hypothetical protein
VHTPPISGDRGPRLRAGAHAVRRVNVKIAVRPANDSAHRARSLQIGVPAPATVRGPLGPNDEAAATRELHLPCGALGLAVSVNVLGLDEPLDVERFTIENHRDRATKPISCAMNRLELTLRRILILYGSVNQCSAAIISTAKHRHGSSVSNSAVVCPSRGALTHGTEQTTPNRKAWYS